MKAAYEYERALTRAAELQAERDDLLRTSVRLSAEVEKLQAERDALDAELDRMTEALARRIAAGDFDNDPVWYRHMAKREARKVAGLLPSKAEETHKATSEEVPDHGKV